MSKKQNFSKGRQREDEAKIYLIKNGFEFIESNFSCDLGEIDLIMDDKGWLVFVEVKYKNDDIFGRPEEMIDKRKMAQVKRVAEYYLIKNPQIEMKYRKYRIDAVCILGNEVKYYENVEI